MAGRAVGWYRLPRSGQLYHGTIPLGVETVDAPGLEPDVESEGPAKSAKVAVWREFAQALGVDVDGLTKAEIIEAVEQLVDAGEDGSAVGGEVAGVELGADTEQPGAGPGQEDEA